MTFKIYFKMMDFTSWNLIDTAIIFPSVEKVNFGNIKTCGCTVYIYFENSVITVMLRFQAIQV
jgi:hypothetical protein